MVVAQALTVSGILNLLKPVGGFGILAYIIMIMDVITLFLQGKTGTLALTMFLAIGILTALINELAANVMDGAGSSSALGTGVFKDMLTMRPITFPNFMVGVVMFVMPLIVAGMTKSGKSRGPAIIAVISSLIFVFINWLNSGAHV